MSVVKLYRMAEARSRKFKLRLDDWSASDSDEENVVHEVSSPSTKNKRL